MQEQQENRDQDVYGLIGRLCESLLNASLSSRTDLDEQQAYLGPGPDHHRARLLRRLRAKAYGILLNKSGQVYEKNNKTCDPIVELLKHIFVLKTEAGRFSQAAELQKYLDEYIDEELEPGSVVYSTLQFLNCLKSVEAEDDDSLDIFYYDKPHPALPEMYCEENNIPPFQIYPAEAFQLPKRFEIAFKKENFNFVRYNVVEPGSQLALLGRFTSSNIKSIRHNKDINPAISDVSKSTYNLPSGKSLELTSYFLPQIKDIEISENNFQSNSEGIVTEPESPWQCRDPLQSFIENGRNNSNNTTEICEIEENETEEQEINLDKIWEEMDKISVVVNHVSWETLGSSKPSKEAPFASESTNAMIHLINVAQDNIFSNQDASMRPVKVPSKEFINNIKLLLLGVESSTFIYNQSSGFEFKKNVTVKGISSRTLENTCTEVTRWGTCYRNLSDLVVVDSQTGKLQIEGLIFKALSSSIKEFLLFYHAAILKISINDNENEGLLNYLNKVTPLGNLILKVAQLCRCDSQRLTSLDEGIGILTHIYKEVTKVTEQNVALVFYSILKHCCEVYFKFLQHWIFEGVCTDIYDEFMITVRPKYLRTRGNRFWTRAFCINQKSVPGFLSDLTNSILQCGKAVTLLKICDPQNPLCRLSVSCQPQIHVCLSVGMLREQAKFYEDYVRKGTLEQEEEVSLSTAIQQQKEAERKRAELVMAAQQVTLLRLKKEREDALRKITKEKLELLEQLREQAEQAALRKEKDRDAELLADKLFLESIAKQEQEAKNIERIERENTIKYYNELAEDAKKRRVRADWRIRRMKLFDKRLSAISKLKREFSNTPDESEYCFNIDEEPQKLQRQMKKEVNKEINCDTLSEITEKNEAIIIDNANCTNIIVSEVIADKIDTQEIMNKDENSNPTCLNINKTPIKDQNVNPLDEENQNISTLPEKSQNFDIETVTKVKAIRPSVLDITGVNNQKHTKDFDKFDGLQNDEKATLDLLKFNGTDNMTQAQRNKLKVLQQEYGFTPNNNESSTILFAMENTENQSELTEIQRNRLRNTQHLTHLNWDNVELEKQSSREDETNEEKTEIQLNRLRNTQHLIDFNYNKPEEKETPVNEQPLTEAEINRNKVMSHFYNRMEELEQFAPSKSENLTDCQRNRNRNMAHNVDQFDFQINRFPESEPLKETPMSTTTDHFTISTHSSSMPAQSCENTPFSEITNHSDLLYARSSSDGLSTDGTTQSRVSKHFQDTPSFPNFFGFGSVPSTPANENQQLTAADVEMIDTTSLKVYLEKSVLIPLRAQSRLVNNAIIKYLLNEHQMLSHLQSLRSYFFLLKGEFAKSLTQSLFTRLYEAESPVELFNSSSLMNLLEKALVSSLSSTYANSELLSLSAIKVPAILQTSNPEIFDCLSLNYKISWPLNIIFNDLVMEQYSKVFKFLLMVGRVLWVLQEDFHILKIARVSSISQNHHKLQLYRHTLMQFMNALHTYLTCSVLHASWSEFEKELENAKTLDEFCDTHVSYMKKILSRCMLNARGETMRTCLCNIFKIVLKFHNRVRSQNWSGGNARLNYKDLESMYLCFCEQRSYLAHVAEKLANCGYQPHLMQFLHALNINYRYDLVPKK